MRWFSRDKPFDALGSFEVDRLLMLSRLFKNGHVHEAMIHCHDGRFVLLDMGPNHSDVRKDILTFLQIAYDAVATTTMMITNADHGAEVASAIMIADMDSVQMTQMYVWRARIQRDRPGVVTGYIPLGHDSVPESFPPIAGVRRRPTRGERARALKYLAAIPEASAPWIVK